MERNEKDMLDPDDYTARRKHPVMRNPVLLWIVGITILIFLLGAFVALRS